MLTMLQIKGSKMKEPVLKAVAYPPKIFWAPWDLAMANFALQMFLLFIIAIPMDINPLWVVASIVSVHSVLIAWGTKDPQLSNILKSRGPFIMKNHHQIYSSKGKKMAS